MNRPEPNPLPLPSRCREVRDTLGRAPGRLDAEFRSDHLAECPSCAEAVEATHRLALAWNAARPTPPVGSFDATWSQVLARVEAGEGIVSNVLPLPRRPHRALAVTALVLSQAAAVLIGWMALRPIDTTSQAAPLLAMLDDAPKVIDIEPSEVLILRFDREGSLDRRDIDALEISDTETVGFDTPVLAYFEARGGS
ncbi:MAG: hypothetical protein U0800_21140 [Isosphaeraceae bacterium]